MSNRPSKRGEVILAGAGPGDPALLTVKALRALEEADVVLFDHLVTQPILDLVPPGVPRICVGKRAGQPSCAQEQINRLMIRLARTGRHVVRLKAGDPSVFGRSGEEISALTVAGVPVSVVPGITTASALAASLGVSLTHRACARSLRFVTAHGAKGGMPDDLDWLGLADGATTLIVYMGGRTGPALAERLIEAGRSALTPVVVAENVTRGDERFTRTTLGHFAAGTVALSPGAAVTIAIGDVFGDEAAIPITVSQTARPLTDAASSAAL